MALSRIARQHGHMAEAGSREPSFAALDLGTNNCRLLVARPKEGGFHVVDSFSRIVRLGEGMAATRRLCDGAVKRTIEALRVCAEKMGRNGVSHARCVATAACRRAVNCDDFIERARDATGLAVEIISSGEEARLAVEGCIPLFDPAMASGLMFDIGGGSTELIWLSFAGETQPRLSGSLSLPFGVVTLAEQYGPEADQAGVFAEVVDRVTAHLGPFDRQFGIRGRVAASEVQMLGTSGTVTTLAAVHMSLPRYERSRVDGAFLSFADVDEVSRRLSAMDLEARRSLPCVGPGRADLVVIGCAILQAICRMWPVGRLRVADRGLREGILLDLMRKAGVQVDAPVTVAPCPAL